MQNKPKKPNLQDMSEIFAEAEAERAAEYQCKRGAAALDTFLANLHKAVSDRETVVIGGGEFNHNELRTVYSAVLALIAKAK